MDTNKLITPDEVKKVGAELGISWEVIDPEEFRRGIDKELTDSLAMVQEENTVQNLLAAAQTVHSHLTDDPDYYLRQRDMEDLTKYFWDIDLKSEHGIFKSLRFAGEGRKPVRSAP
ncbi:hypothetical protein AUK40_02970 [Candidatus Wirthbacteria bacterium CG2_30_54_11]|uniref:Uncharacterized protein n=1 Tax=Candidatus Wirthbacteria bacterium CG2_30_54_11 TaxID=1817892 RepID=A0A1J5IKC1_9BACT|nr:MAG: hypothetical protein AUK40_02970 [Candidatus Wirthbacteria bacterium CG2_30_54_11]